MRMTFALCVNRCGEHLVVESEGVKGWNRIS